MAGFLDKERTIAGPTFNRWLVPPAALCIHLCIGMAYGFSVFWLPLTKALGISKSIECPADMSWVAQLFTTACDWDKPILGWMYTLFFVFLGSSAALWGGWLERAGPRKAGVVAAVCWCGGLLISAFGIHIHQLWLMWLGSGVIGGVGLGLGYISPVSTLIKWFPDRRGMATGLAIMGFGGGAMIGTPLADALMHRFATPVSVGVWETFVVLGTIYFAAMMTGAFGYRLPPPGWTPQEGRSRDGVGTETSPSPLRPRQRGMENAAILAVVGGALPERQRRHRRARRRLADDPGDLQRPRHRVGRRGVRRPAQPVQHRRPHLLGVTLRSARAQNDVWGVLRPRHAPLRQRADGRRGQPGAVRRHLLRDPDDVRRRIRNDSGVPRRSVRRRTGQRDSRTAVDGVVHGRRTRTGARQLHPRVSDRTRGPALGRVYVHDVHPGRAAR